eukprot:Colp12_sorted_trinity150504_noHs@12925
MPNTRLACVIQQGLEYTAGKVDLLALLNTLLNRYVHKLAVEEAYTACSLASHGGMSSHMCKLHAEDHITSVARGRTDDVAGIYVLDCGIATLRLEQLVQGVLQSHTNISVYSVARSIFLPLYDAKLLSGTLRYDDYTVVGLSAESFQDVISDLFESERNLWQKTNVNITIRKGGMESNETAITTHKLDNADSMWCTTGLLVSCSNGSLCSFNSSIKTKCLLNVADVIVNSFGNSDNRNTETTFNDFFCDGIGALEGTISSDGEQKVNFLGNKEVDHNPNVLVSARASQNSSSKLVNVTDNCRVKLYFLG